MMKSRFKLVIYFLSFLATVSLAVIANNLFQKDRMEKIHVLEAPMSIGSEKDNNYYLIPKGTHLYYDTVFPEGFTRYKIYVNVKEKLLLHDNIQGVEAPLSADSITKTQLINILKNVKLDKDDIKAILANGKFSDEEKKEIASFIRLTPN